MGNEPSKRATTRRGTAATTSPGARPPASSSQRVYSAFANNNAHSVRSDGSKTAATTSPGRTRSSTNATATAATTTAAAPVTLSHVSSLQDSGIFVPTVSPVRSRHSHAASTATTTNTMTAASTVSPSMPRYMDRSSVLYALPEEPLLPPAPPQQQQHGRASTHMRVPSHAILYSPPAAASHLTVSQELATLSPMLPDRGGAQQQQQQQAQQQQQPLSSSGSRATSTPLVIRTPLTAATPAIVIPTYRHTDTLMDHIDGSSPMLRSYRHSSFSRPATLTTTTAAAGGLAASMTTGGHAQSPLHPSSPAVAASHGRSASNAFAWAAQTPPTRALSVALVNTTAAATTTAAANAASTMNTTAVTPSSGSFPFGIAAAAGALRPTSSMSALQTAGGGGGGSGVYNNKSMNNSGGSRNGSMAAAATAAMPGMGASSQSNHALLAAAAAAAAATSSSSSSSSKVPRHTRYVEITSYPLGMENYGNTCYCNAVVQLLYHCTPLRLRLLELNEVYESKKGGVGFEEGTVLAHLCRLMSLMHKSNNGQRDRRAGQSIAPLALLQCVRSSNAAFRGNDQQDAHEFAMYVLNDILETEQRIMSDPRNRALFSETRMKRNSFAFWRSSRKHASHAPTSQHARTSSEAAGGTSPSLSSSSLLHMSLLHADASADAAAAATSTMTPLQAIVQGQFGSLTACLECGNVSSRREVFLDLNLDTRQGSSLLQCLHHFADPEFFFGDNKVRCDRCARAVRAAKTIHVCQLPQYALIVHLKRFRYDAARGTFSKTADHVALPMEMDVEEYETESPLQQPQQQQQQQQQQHEGEDEQQQQQQQQHEQQHEHEDTTPPVLSDAVSRRLRGVARHKARFTLTGFVAHLGEGANEGHYFTCIRYSPQLWRRFDDESVTSMTEREVQQMFGVPIAVHAATTTTAYILLYERVA